MTYTELIFKLRGTRYDVHFDNGVYAVFEKDGNMLVVAKGISPQAAYDKWFNHVNEKTFISRDSIKELKGDVEHIERIETALSQGDRFYIETLLSDWKHELNQRINNIK